uniref:Uncharacterized protein n=1 Tax=Arundo donax TaxID=35708 RepID=A0A0A9FCC3_ARUDO
MILTLTKAWVNQVSE